MMTSTVTRAAWMGHDGETLAPNLHLLRTSGHSSLSTINMTSSVYDILPHYTAANPLEQFAEE